MKQDIFNKVILSCILIALIAIAYNIAEKETMQMQPTNYQPVVDVSNTGNNIVQISPNVIGIIDKGYKSGWEQLVIFEYNPETKEFDIVSSLPYEDYFNHPLAHRIPTRSEKYGE